MGAGATSGWDGVPPRQSSPRIAGPRRWRLGLNRLAGAAALASLALTAACNSAIRTPTAESRVPQEEPSGLDRSRNVTSLAKTPGRRLPDAASSYRADAAERAGIVRMASLDQDAAPMRPRPIPPPSAPSGQAVTELVPFEAAPFPYDGVVPGKGPFLDAGSGARRGHRTWRGVLWEDRTFGDNRVLVHIPAGFDPNRQAVIVVFYHGHGATLERDVRDRQQIAAQISASGANAVLLAPQFAVDARDSSAGKFWEPGGFGRFLGEAATRLAALRGDRASAQRFARMPVVLVSYSGGYIPASWSLKDAAASRVRGVLMLDSLYGEETTFANWLATSKSAFFVSAYTRYTTRHNTALAGMLADRGIASGNALPESLSRGGAVFLASGPEANHQDYCTQAWTENPIADLLARLPELYVRDPDTVASIGPRSRRRSADVQPR